MTASNCDLAIAILKNTEDGEQLAPEHLRLVEDAVNGPLDETKSAIFRTLHADVLAGTYRKPWLHGVENLTRDHEGYVYWKEHR